MTIRSRNAATASLGALLAVALCAGVPTAEAASHPEQRAATKTIIKDPAYDQDRGGAPNVPEVRAAQPYADILRNNVERNGANVYFDTKTRDIVDVQAKGTDLEQAITWFTQSGSHQIFVDTTLIRRAGQRQVKSVLTVDGRSQSKCVAATRLNHKTNTIRVVVKRSCLGVNTSLDYAGITAGVVTKTKTQDNVLAARDHTDSVTKVPVGTNPG